MYYFYKYGYLEFIGEFKTIADGMKYANAQNIDMEDISYVKKPDGKLLVCSVDDWNNEIDTLAEYETRELAYAFAAGFHSIDCLTDLYIIHPDGTVETA